MGLGQRSRAQRFRLKPFEYLLERPLAKEEGEPAAELALQQLMAEESARASLAPDPDPPEQDTPPAGTGLAPDPEPPEIEDREQGSPLHGEDWILGQAPGDYTIQVIALSSRENLEKLIDGHEDLSPLAIAAPKRELEQIVASCNGLLQRLETSLLRERQFASDAAH